MFFTLTFEKSYKPSRVEIFITSHSNAYGVIGGSWVEGDVYSTSIPSKGARLARFSLKAVKMKDHQSTTKCSKTLSYYVCMGLELQKKEHYKNCSKFCIPIIWKTLIELSSNESFAICETVEENYCMATLMNNVFTYKTKQCHVRCEQLKYSARKMYDPTYWPESDMEMALNFPSANLIEYEEYVIYDWIGLIGSIGGSLGLFIGFSFRDVFSYMIQLAHENLFVK